LQGITGEKITRPEWEVPASVMELVALLPLCNLSICLLLTKDQIEVLVEMTSDGKNFLIVTHWTEIMFFFVAVIRQLIEDRNCL